ncbi:hypothetical protein EMIT093MI4_40118 [Pseudomonas sp. IT-93MI4]
MSLVVSGLASSRASSLPQECAFQCGSEPAREGAIEHDNSPCISLVLSPERWQTANPFTPFVLRLYANVF